MQSRKITHSAETHIRQLHKCLLKIGSSSQHFKWDTYQQAVSNKQLLDFHKQKTAQSFPPIVGIYFEDFY